MSTCLGHGSLFGKIGKVKKSGRGPRKARGFRNGITASLLGRGKVPARTRKPGRNPSHGQRAFEPETISLAEG
jgi:hypothetical protein